MLLILRQLCIRISHIHLLHPLFPQCCEHHAPLVPAKLAAGISDTYRFQVILIENHTCVLVISRHVYDEDMFVISNSVW